MKTTNKYKQKLIQYEKTIINFVFSFSWDVTKYSFNDISQRLKGNYGWDETPLYDRPLTWLKKENVNATYHPTIRAKNLKVLYKTNLISEKLSIIIPLKDNDKRVIDKMFFDYTMRIFENGTGTFTFSVQLDKELSLDKILLIQHLATSIYYEENSKRVRNTHAFIDIETIKEKYKPRNNNKPIYLAELFSNILRTQKTLTEFLSFKDNDGESDKFIDKKDDWQNPYVITILKTIKNNENDELKRIFSSKGDERRNITKEIGAIAVRLTEDNGDNAEEYYKRLRREYIFKTLGAYPSPTDNKSFEMKLRNYSHNRNLFYTYGRRGAIAITDDFTSHPSYFAIPTLINIIEIMRSRWHLGTVANLLLDETYEKIAHTDSVSELINDVYKCRILYGLFLQNPTPYLFDSGAITEMSDTADKVFWFDKISNELEKKLNALDKLTEVIYTRERILKYK